jgi:hypothetical protein
VRTTSAVRRLYRAACTTVLRRASDDDKHLLPRVDAYYVRDCRALSLVLAGKRDAYLALRRFGRDVRSRLHP